MFIVFFIMFCITALISWLWVRGIDNMKRNHPDYNGEDFLSLNEELKKGEDSGIAEDFEPKKFLEELHKKAKNKI